VADVGSTISKQTPSPTDSLLAIPHPADLGTMTS